MSTNALEQVIAYHEATKHHPHRYARSLGYLDWATQPNPFRRFEGAEWTPLSLPELPALPSYPELFNPAPQAHGWQPAGPAQPLTLQSISLFLYGSLAISAWKHAGQSTWSLRVNPSSGNLHPTEGYLLLGPLPDLSEHSGLYHYAPRQHGLERRRQMPSEPFGHLLAGLPADSFLVGLSSIHWREAWKYGERAFRYCQHDVGHALAALRFAAAALGWRVTLLGDLSSEQIASLLALDRSEDFQDAELEEPELLAVITTRPRQGPPPCDLPAQAIETVGHEPTLGRANRLSPDRVAWEIIDEIAAVTRKPTGGSPWDSPPPSPPTDARGDLDAAHAHYASVSAWQIIRQRRSAVAFDGSTSISEEVLYRMLLRTMPDATAPWDLLTWSPRIHLLLFVHRVRGLQPGLYLLLRDPSREAFVRAALTRCRDWRRPVNCPTGLPLFMLEEGDARRAAETLSLGQEIAADGAFSLGMLGELDRSLTEYGPWFYRHLYWEAGMVGQTLYLEAEAWQVRATGIGAYFDDQVHELVGINTTALQSLYHFTVGGPVEDPRITSLPAYPGP